ncbi:MAG: hypothetical protein HY721_00825 [Planctomycetes bacterium]|nr:hypothetical protein [Planctomycetota bacterium]
MRPEELLRLLRVRPFKPLRICTSDGAGFEIQHPEQVLVTRSTFVIGLEPDARTGVWRRWEHCSPLHVTRVEMASGGAA